MDDRDLSCVSDLTGAMTESTGTLVLVEALARRIQTPRGRLIDDPLYGTDVTGLLNADVDSSLLTTIAADMDAEFQKDERVLTSQTTASYDGAKLTTTTLVTGASGPFKLTLSISDVSVDILSVTP